MMTGATLSRRQRRQHRIVDYVVARGSSSTAELVTVTGASTATVHRDLDELEASGILRKYHGGVSPLPATVLNTSSRIRRRTNTAAKATLARAARRFIRPGMSLMLDDSSTAFTLAQLLPGTGPLTVVTNYYPTIEVLRCAPDIQLLALGGQYSQVRESFVGLQAQDMIGTLSVDLTLQSATAVDADMAFHDEHDSVLVKRAMLRAASTSVLLVDASKVGHRALHAFTPMGTFDHLLLTGPLDDEFIAAANDATNLHIVNAP